MIITLIYSAYFLAGHWILIQHSGVEKLTMNRKLKAEGVVLEYFSIFSYCFETLTFQNFTFNITPNDVLEFLFIFAIKLYAVFLIFLFIYKIFLFIVSGKEQEMKMSMNRFFLEYPLKSDIQEKKPSKFESIEKRSKKP